MLHRRRTGNWEKITGVGGGIIQVRTEGGRWAAGGRAVKTKLRRQQLTCVSEIKNEYSGQREQHM